MPAERWSDEQRAKFQATMARKRSEAPPRVRNVGIRCDLCGVTAADKNVLRFGLTRHVKVRARETTRSAGSIDLCQPCWVRTAARRLRGQTAAPRQRRKRAA